MCTLVIGEKKAVEAAVTDFAITQPTTSKASKDALQRVFKGLSGDQKPDAMDEAEIIGLFRYEAVDHSRFLDEMWEKFNIHSTGAPSLNTMKLYWKMFGRGFIQVIGLGHHNVHDRSDFMRQSDGKESAKTRNVEFRHREEVYQHLRLAMICLVGINVLDMPSAMRYVQHIRDETSTLSDPNEIREVETRVRVELFMEAMMSQQKLGITRDMAVDDKERARLMRLAWQGQFTTESLKTVINLCRRKCDMSININTLPGDDVLLKKGGNFDPPHDGKKSRRQRQKEAADKRRSETADAGDAGRGKGQGKQAKKDQAELARLRKRNAELEGARTSNPRLLQPEDDKNGDEDVPPPAKKAKKGNGKDASLKSTYQCRDWAENNFAGKCRFGVNCHYWHDKEHEPRPK
jgi:hypothetical protein